MPMGGPLSLWEKPSCKKLRGPMGGTKSKPNAVDSIWNGGARERQNECAMSFAIEMKSSWQAICRLPRAGAEGGIRTLARFNPSTPLAGEPLIATWVLLQLSIAPRQERGGGESGIRTHGSCESPVFKTGSLNHSDISPC